MPATSKTIIRMWNKDGYHKDVLIMDSDQVRMSEGRVEDSTGSMLMAGDIGGARMVVDPSKFPEAVCFEVIVIGYKR